MEINGKVVIEMGRAGCRAGEVRRKGYIRKGYTRKDGTRVEATRVAPGCIVDRGAPGKTPASKRWARFPKGEYLPGWSKDASAKTRHAAVNRVARSTTCREAWRRLDQLAKVSTDPETKKKALADRQYIRKQGWCPWKTQAGK